MEFLGCSPTTTTTATQNFWTLSFWAGLLELKFPGHPQSPLPQKIVGFVFSQASGIWLEFMHTGVNYGSSSWWLTWKSGYQLLVRWQRFSPVSFLYSHVFNRGLCWTPNSPDPLRKPIPTYPDPLHDPLAPWKISMAWSLWTTSLTILLEALQTTV